MFATTINDFAFLHHRSREQARSGEGGLNLPALLHRGMDPSPHAPVETVPGDVPRDADRVEHRHSCIQQLPHGVQSPADVEGPEHLPDPGGGELESVPPEPAPSKPASEDSPVPLAHVAATPSLDVVGEMGGAPGICLPAKQGL